MGRKLKATMYFVILFAISLGLAFLILQLGGDGTPEGGASFIDDYKIPLAIFRISVCIAFVVAWPYAIDFFAERNEWPDEKTVALKGIRWKIAFWLVILELVVVQGLIAKFFGLFF